MKCDWFDARRRVKNPHESIMFIDSALRRFAKYRKNSFYTDFGLVSVFRVTALGF